jgi:uncharacterized membrane protein
VGAPGGPARRRLALLLAALAAVGLAVAAYLTIRKLSGAGVVCVIGSGCDTIEASPHSLILGIPVAAFGVAWSAVALGSALLWWRTADPRALLVLYVGGLVATIAEAYLVYLELFVIRAVCSWCVLYGITVVLGWIGAIVALRLARDPVAPTSD